MYSSNEYCIDVWLIIFIILGRPSKGEYSGLSDVEKCKRSKEVKNVNKGRKTMSFVKSYGASN